ncbi:subtilase-type protease inhibitor [Thermopolyspora flexuosa]|jgi:hypothetical protein|uniref:Subtilisin inhibitor-like n=1 Tax=Thermopolyspora flexuosa TaxID=103836 RepID=A0A543IVU3_9ACTN|nr:SSI family serine proteinase inhibitor [Thermopolyspora flexuosa]TQM74696.1 subtilisin inhibitor-like [Thermopolyspora flexuosa]GGM78167.1 subtilase-type protease inhibitor [Thermopolyspora flexuosa]
MKAITMVALGAALLLAAAPGATADSTPKSEMTLTVTRPDGSNPQSVTLTCDPDGGTHPSPREACDLLRSVDGEIGLLRRSPGTACTREYAPRLASARGVWRRTKQFAVTRTYSNRCEMLATTGVLFEFAR